MERRTGVVVALASKTGLPIDVFTEYLESDLFQARKQRACALLSRRYFQLLATHSRPYSCCLPRVTPSTAAPASDRRVGRYGGEPVCVPNGHEAVGTVAIRVSRWSGMLAIALQRAEAQIVNARAAAWLGTACPEQSRVSSFPTIRTARSARSVCHRASRPGELFEVRAGHVPCARLRRCASWRIWLSRFSLAFSSR
jgi:hypothetical protein